jgi:hypothetical protein
MSATVLRKSKSLPHGIASRQGLKILVYRDSFPCIRKIDIEWRVVSTIATEQGPVSKYSAVGTRWDQKQIRLLKYWPIADSKSLGEKINYAV